MVLAVGRLVEKKGFDVLLKAMAGVQEELRAPIAVVGDGPLRQELADSASRLGLRVNFLGAQPHERVRMLMADATVVVVPSRTAASGDAEGLPNVVVEAMASACPVIATRHAGIPEVVSDGTTGLLVPENDVGSLGRALTALLSDDVLQLSMGLSARATVEGRFALASQMEKLESLYDRVVVHLRSDKTKF